MKSNTGESLLKLQLYDGIKCNMEVTKNALEEADNWTKLITDIEMVITNKLFELIMKKKMLTKVLFLVNG